MLILRNLAFYPAFYLGSFLIVVMAGACLLVGHDRGFRHHVSNWARWHRWCVTRLLGIELEIRGTRPAGAVLVALKHESFFEAIDLPLLLPNPAVFIKQELRRIPLWGWLAERYGLVPVARDQGARALRRMLQVARERAAEDRVLAIFPEGTRVPHGTRPPLQAGFAGLYKQLNLKVVPVAVVSGPSYHHLLKRPGKIVMQFGEAIPPGLPREAIEAQVHAAINALNQGDTP